MPTKQKVDSLGYNTLGYECEGEEVVKIWCKTCRDFYSRENISVGSSSSKSFIKGQVDKYVEGTTRIKKVTFLTILVKVLPMLLLFSDSMKNVMKNQLHKNQL